MDEVGPLCMGCADLDHLEFLPRGDTALTRRARKTSRLSAVVVQWSRARKRYERQGVLAEPDAIAQAEQDCLADSEVRERRRVRDAQRRAVEDEQLVADLAAALLGQFPGCPPDRALLIAQHAGARSSGRIGRTSAGRALEAEAVRLAVVAAVQQWTDRPYQRGSRPGGRGGAAGRGRRGPSRGHPLRRSPHAWPSSRGGPRTRRSRHRPHHQWMAGRAHDGSPGSTRCRLTGAKGGLSPPRNRSARCRCGVLRRVGASVEKSLGSRSGARSHDGGRDHRNNSRPIRITAISHATAAWPDSCIDRAVAFRCVPTPRRVRCL